MKLSSRQLAAAPQLSAAAGSLYTPGRLLLTDRGRRDAVRHHTATAAAAAAAAPVVPPRSSGVSGGPAAAASQPPSQPAPDT